LLDTLFIGLNISSDGRSNLQNQVLEKDKNVTFAQFYN